MSEKGFAAIFIGGRLPYQKLREALATRKLGLEIEPDKLPESPESIEQGEPNGVFTLDKMGRLHYEDTEAVGGMFEKLEKWLQTNGIPYDRVNDELPARWGAEVVMYRPEMEEPVNFVTSMSVGYLPYASLDKIRIAIAIAKTLDEFKEWFQKEYSVPEDLQAVTFV